MWLVWTCMILFLVSALLLFTTGNWTYFVIACAFQIIMLWEAGAVGRYREQLDKMGKEHGSNT